MAYCLKVDNGSLLLDSTLTPPNCNYILFDQSEWSSYVSTKATVAADNTLLANTVGVVDQLVGNVNSLFASASNSNGVQALTDILNTIFLVPSSSDLVSLWTIGFSLPASVFLVAWGAGKLINMVK